LARELIIPFLITANYQTSLAIRQLRGELSQLPAELTALRAAAAEVYAIGAMGLFSMGMLAAGASQLASSLIGAQRMAALAAIASGQFAGASAIASQVLAEAVKLAASSSESLGSVTEAYLEAARAGLSLAEASSLLPESLNLAVTSSGDLSEVLRMTFAIMRNMGIPITRETAKTITAQLSYALDRSLMDIEDVMNAIKYVGPIAGQLQIPFSDLMASLMLLHDAGIRASIAGTGLARMLVRLEAPTAQARKRLAELGIDFHKIRPSTNDLADIIDLLANNVDELTIRLLLGERAERAFYAIVQQGTDRLRQYSKELRALGETGDYAQRKMQAFAQVPAQRLAIALNKIRTYGAVLVEPLVKFQVAVSETLGSLFEAVATSPFLSILTKTVVGFSSLFGTVTLVGASIAWLAGRFLELGTIWQHLLLVLDRLQAAVRSLTLSAVKTPLLGLVEGFKALILPWGGGIERLAQFISERLRISELVSAMTQPLVFWRRARRIPPFLQPLPEWLSLQFGSMAAAAEKLGMPLEQFLFAGATFGALKPLPLRVSEVDWRTFLRNRLLATLERFDYDMMLAIGETILQLSGGQILAEPYRLALAETIRRAFSDILIRNIHLPFDRAIEQTVDQLQSLIASGKLGIDAFVKMAGIKDLGKFAEAAVRTFYEALNREFAKVVATSFERVPEVVAAAQLSVDVLRSVRRTSELLRTSSMEAFEEILENFAKSADTTLRELDKPILPLLNEYQRKIAAILRHANIPQFTKALLMGAAGLPLDLITSAVQVSIGAMSGIAARRLPLSPRRLMQTISDLANEVAAYLNEVPNVFEAAFRIGIAFASPFEKLPSPGTIRSLITERFKRLQVLQQLRLLGLATAEQLNEISNIQIQLGLLSGLYTSSKLQTIFKRSYTQLQRLATTRVAANLEPLQKLISQIVSKPQFEQLRNVLLRLSLDLPALVGQVIRQGPAAFKQLRDQFLALGAEGEAAFAQLRPLLKSLYLTHNKFLKNYFEQQALAIKSMLQSFGLQEETIAEIITMIEAGLFMTLTEQMALKARTSEMKQVYEEAANSIRSRVATFWDDLKVALRFIGGSIVALIRLPISALGLQRWLPASYGFASRSMGLLRGFLRNFFGSLWTALATALAAPIIPPVPIITAFRSMIARIINSLLGGPWATVATGIVQPILNLLPQFLAGVDISRALKGVSLLGRGVGFLFRFGLAGIIASFILDLIPWEDIGYALRLSPKTMSIVKSLGSYLRAAVVGIFTGLFGVLKLTVWDTIAGIIDWFRGGRGVLRRWHETIMAIGSRIEESFRQISLQREYEAQQLEIQNKQTLMMLQDTFRGIVEAISVGWKGLTTTATQITRRAGELARLLGMTGEIVPAPIGIAENIAEIGRVAVIFANAADEFADVRSKLQELESFRVSLSSIMTELGRAGGNLYQVLSTILQQPVEALESMPSQVEVEKAWQFLSPERLRLREQVLAFARQLGTQPGGLAYLLMKIRDQLLALPPERRVELAGTLNWLNQAIGQIQQASAFLDYYVRSAPGARAQLRDQLRQTLTELASVLSQDQIRAHLIDPLRRAYEELGNTISEQLEKLVDIMDPIRLREIAKSIAEAQFAFLTEQARVVSEVMSTWSELWSELGLPERSVALLTQAGDRLLAAFERVLEVARMPSPTWQQALQELSAAFEAAGLQSERFRVKLAELQRLFLMRSYFGLTEETRLEISKRIAELGKDVLGFYERARKEVLSSRDEALELLSDYEDAGVAAISWLDDAIDRESRFMQLLQQEAALRQRILVALGVPYDEAARAVSRFVATQSRQLKLLRSATISQIMDIANAQKELASMAGDYLTEFMRSQEVASTALQSAMSSYSLAQHLIQRAAQFFGSVRTMPAKAAEWLSKYYSKLREAAEASADVKVWLFGLQAIWSTLKDLFPQGGNLLRDFAEQVAQFGVLLRAGIERWRYLWWQLVQIPATTWQGYITRLRIQREMREIVDMLFAAPEQIAETVSRWTNVLSRFVEEGFIPSIFASTLPEVRQTLLSNLIWLRNFYAYQLGVLMQMQMQVPFGTTVWLRLNEQIIATVENLADVERKLRDIRMELLSLELYAVPERIAEFIVERGPALTTFLRTGPTTAVSTIQFSINIYAQDVQAGVQQALFEAQRRLQGFNMQPVF